MNYLSCFLLSQRESFVTVKFFDPKISMIFDISELPESKYAFSGKCLYVYQSLALLFVRKISVEQKFYFR